MSVYPPATSGWPIIKDSAESLLARARLREAEIFQLALRADSNRELDWLWLSMQLTDLGRRRYSLERALAINPSSAIARRELELLDATA